MTSRKHLLLIVGLLALSLIIAACGGAVAPTQPAPAQEAAPAEQEVAQAEEPPSRGAAGGEEAAEEEPPSRGSAPATFTVGQEVVTQSPFDGAWYQGNITEVAGDGTSTVKFDPGNGDSPIQVRGLSPDAILTLEQAQAQGLAIANAPGAASDEPETESAEASSDEAEEAATSPFTVGQEVVMQFDGAWYQGSITEVAGDGTSTVRFDPGNGDSPIEFGGLLPDAILTLEQAQAQGVAIANAPGAASDQAEVESAEASSDEPAAEEAAANAFTVGQEVAVNNSGNWVKGKITRVEGNKVEVSLGGSSIPLFEAHSGWILTLDQAKQQGITLPEAAPASSSGEQAATGSRGISAAPTYTVGQEVAVNNAGRWLRGTITQVDGNKVEVSYTDGNKRGKFPLFEANPGWVLTLDQAKQQGITLAEAAPASSSGGQSATSNAPAACSDYKLGEFYAVLYEGVWWKAQHDKCLANNDPQFKIEGITWLSYMMKQNIKTLDQAKAENLSLREPGRADLTCDPANGYKPAAANLSQSEIQAILDGHAKVRQGKVQNVNLQWDDKLAQFAQGWATALSDHYDKGVVAPFKNWPHSAESCYHKTYASQYGSVGAENIGTVEGFAAEEPYYDVNSRRCSGGECGHYVQMVANRVTKVGCGKTNAGGLVCQYDAYGMMIQADGSIIDPFK